MDYGEIISQASNRLFTLIIFILISGIETVDMLDFLFGPLTNVSGDAVSFSVTPALVADENTTAEVDTR